MQHTTYTHRRALQQRNKSDMSMYMTVWIWKDACVTVMADMRGQLPSVSSEKVENLFTLAHTRLALSETAIRTQHDTAKYSATAPPSCSSPYTLCCCYGDYRAHSCVQQRTAKYTKKASSSGFFATFLPLILCFLRVTFCNSPCTKHDTSHTLSLSSTVLRSPCSKP